jgi:hypothetical protein
MCSDMVGHGTWGGGQSSGRQHAMVAVVRTAAWARSEQALTSGPRPI